MLKVGKETRGKKISETKMEVELGYTIISRIVLKKFYINNLLHGVRRQTDHVQCITSYPINGVFILFKKSTIYYTVCSGRLW